MTVFSNEEETIATKYYLGGDELHYWPQNALTYAGGNYSRGDQDWASYIVVDRELVTGQNNKSSTAVGKAVIDLLNE